MVKHGIRNVSLMSLLLLSSCKSPFCCCQQDKAQTQEFKKTLAVTTDEATVTVNSPLSIASAEEFDREVLKATMPVVVDFFAEWCGPCKASRPIFDAVAKQLGSTYKFVTINVDKAEKVAQDLGIQGVPTFVFFEKGKEVKRSTGGITGKDVFIATIEKTFGK